MGQVLLLIYEQGIVSFKRVEWLWTKKNLLFRNGTGKGQRHTLSSNEIGSSNQARVLKSVVSLQLSTKRYRKPVCHDKTSHIDRDLRDPPWNAS